MEIPLAFLFFFAVLTKCGFFLYLKINIQINSKINRNHCVSRLAYVLSWLVISCVFFLILF